MPPTHVTGSHTLSVLWRLYPLVWRLSVLPTPPGVAHSGPHSSLSGGALKLCGGLIVRRLQVRLTEVTVKMVLIAPIASPVHIPWQSLIRGLPVRCLAKLYFCVQYGCNWVQKRKKNKNTITHKPTTGLVLWMSLLYYLPPVFRLLQINNPKF